VRPLAEQHRGVLAEQWRVDDASDLARIGLGANAIGGWHSNARHRMVE
jgi:hypothetical protein